MPLSNDAATIGAVARLLRSATGPDERLHTGVGLVLELVGGCDHAGVMIADRHGVTSTAVSDEIVARGDALQFELSEGPCLDTVRAQHTVVSHDLLGDRRWPRWGPRVIDDLGVHAMMSLLLFTDRDTLGALNLYADQPSPWDSDSIAVGHALADQLAAAVADAREIEHRGLAMTGRTIIGQAQGILMERYDIDADRAFAYLRRLSQDHNRKLVAVAGDIVNSRRSTADSGSEET